MKKITAVFLTAALIVTAPTAQAQVTTRKYGYTQKESFFNRISDWFATTGKSQEEKYLIKKNRRAARNIKKIKSDIARKKKQMAR